MQWRILSRGQVYEAMGNKAEAIADFNAAVARTTNQMIIDNARSELKSLGQ